MKHLIRAASVCLVALSLFTSLTARAQKHTPKYVSMAPNTKAYYEYLPEGYNPTGTTTYPLILFMTGIGEFGSGSSTSLPLVLKHGIPQLIQNGLFPKSFTVGTTTHKFIVITPQWLTSPRPTVADIDTVLKYIVKNYKVNTKRIYITGLSYGGGLSFAYPGNANTAYRSRVAAVVPIASPLPDGGYDTIYARSRRIASGNIPVWATHNGGDTQDSASRTIAYVDHINQQAPNPLAKKTIFTGTGTSHDAWTRTYYPNFREKGYNVYEWMLLHQKGSTPPVYGTAPTANAGADQAITLPTSSITLTGSGSGGSGTTKTYIWTKVSGPVEGVITSPTATSTTVTGLARGTYIFRFTVSDGVSAKGSDDIAITVKPATGTKVIQVNVYSGTSAQGSTTLNTWNNWKVTAGTASTVFNYNDGTTTSTVTATLSASAIKDNFDYYPLAYIHNVGMAPAGVLRHASQHNALRTLTIQGLSTTKTYNVELYASYRSTTTNDSTIFKINSTRVPISVNYNKVNKAKFANIAPNTSGQIVVSIDKSSSYNYLNGFMLTEVSSSTASAASITMHQPVEATNTLPSTSEISIIPNPVASRVLLTLRNAYNGAVQVQVVDATGKSLKTLRLVKGSPVLQQYLSVGDLPKGMYFIMVQMGEQRQTTTISKL